MQLPGAVGLVPFAVDDDARALVGQVNTAHEARGVVGRHLGPYLQGPHVESDRTPDRLERVGCRSVRHTPEWRSMVTAAVLLAVAALVIGYSKTSLGGLAVVAVAIFASVLPARASTGAILAVLIVGDLVAIWHYRRDGDWHLVRQLLPTVVPGLVLGTLFLRVVDDTWLRRSIGGLLLALVLLQLALNARTSYAAEPAARTHPPGWAGWATGLGAGFATMTANAAGAVMTLFLVAKGVEKRRFVGTGAWFFFGVNLCKVPFSVGLGLLGWGDVRRALLLAPVVIVGGWLGLVTMRRISQRGFERAVLLASALSALALLVR